MVSEGECGPGGWETRPGVRGFPELPFLRTYNPGVQLHLAEALLADGRFTEARSYLVNLWDRTPGSGEVNIDLAHVAVQTGDMEEAIRYFRGAIFGSWEKDPGLQRRNVRLELCEFLLSHRRTSDAQTEIAGLAADTPSDDGVLREQNGRLFLRVGEPGKALAEFEAALKTNPGQSQWLADAGHVAFEDGDFLKAEAYFARADRENPSDEIHASLMLVRDVLGNDPYLAGLSDEEQSRRTRGDFDQGIRRLHECTGIGSAVHIGDPPIRSPPLNQSDLKDLRCSRTDTKGVYILAVSIICRDEFRADLDFSTFIILRTFDPNPRLTVGLTHDLGRSV